MNLKRYSRILLFGGTFDPPHQAHVRLPEIVRQAINADVIAYVPATQNPLKARADQSSAEHRLAMLRLAVKGHTHAIILTLELERPADQPSYTIDTLKALRPQLAPQATMRLLIGADQLKLFPRWKSADQIVAMAEPAVMVRPPDTVESVLARLPSTFDVDAWRKRFVEVPPMDASSTMVRQRVARGDAIDDLVPSGVEQYIRAHGLYRKQG